MEILIGVQSDGDIDRRVQEMTIGNCDIFAQKSQLSTGCWHGRNKLRPFI